MSFRNFQRLICLMLLAAFAVSGTSIGSAALLLMAELDGSHAVLVNESQAGTCLTLRHRQGEFTPRVCDHSTRLARLVVRLCRSNPAGDHNLVTSHLAGMIDDGNELKREASTAPVPNDQATLLLTAANLWTARDLYHLQPVRLVGSSTRLMQHRALSSVQLLI